MRKIFLVIFVLVPFDLSYEIENLNICSVEICKTRTIETDSKGKSWPVYCYHCKSSEQEVIFKKNYGGRWWTYYTSATEGDANYQYRLIENIDRCSGESFEVDGKGKIWPLWCYDSYEIVKFEKTGKLFWSYVEDNSAGYPSLQYRKINNSSPVLN